VDKKTKYDRELEGEALKHEHIHGGEAYNARTVKILDLKQQTDQMER
jgi:hypothetical protein